MVDDHQHIIHKVCQMYRDTPEDQKDLFQDIVLQLWKAYSAFRNEAKVSTWMYRIALNTAIAVFRKQKVPIDLKENLPEGAYTISKKEQSDKKEKMFTELRKLSSAERAIIALYLDDFSYKEIANITGISENYVGVRLNRIKTKLKKRLA